MRGFLVFCLSFIFMGLFLFSGPDENLLDKETFMEMESISGVDISPDGESILFSRRWIDQMSDRSNSSIWIVDSDGNELPIPALNR